MYRGRTALAMDCVLAGAEERQWPAAQRSVRRHSMRLEFGHADYVELSVAPGTAGIPYDCRVAASIKCGTFSGSTEARLEAHEVQGFLEDLEILASSLDGTARLFSEDGGHSFTLAIAPVDRFGHFGLEVHLGEPWGNSVPRAEVRGTFGFETQALDSIVGRLRAAFMGENDV